MFEPKPLCPHEADALLRKFYDGLTNRAEERRLEAFLASPHGAAAPYEADRAVFSLMAAGRAARSVRGAGSALSRLAVGVAASVMLLVSFHATSHALNPNCVAYIDGTRYTSTDFVMGQMSQTLAQLSPSEEQLTVESQLQAVLGELCQQEKGE
ncbi:MAG: hypothetical protein IJ244_06275 [Bacteroidaceae bacterium]|nr:hypothetical protein [Bacteroidaceae bacterium]